MCGFGGLCGDPVCDLFGGWPVPLTEFLSAVHVHVSGYDRAGLSDQCLPQPTLKTLSSTLLHSCTPKKMRILGVNRLVMRCDMR